MTTNPQTDRVTAVYDAIDGFQRTHRLPGLQHAQLRGLLAEHLARTLPAVVSSPPATDRATLRERIRRAVCEAEGFAWDSDMLEPDEYGEVADMVLAVLPPSVDRAAVLREAADAVQAHPGAIPYRPQLDEDGGFWWDTRDRDAVVDLLRRMADEAQQPAVGAEASADLVEDYLRHLRGQGPAPDLSQLSPEQREAVAGQFEIVTALADRGPELPPLERDPVAQRLGLVDVPAVGAQQPDTETRDALMRAHVALAEQAGRDQAALARVRQLHDRLAKETGLTSPDDPITRGAAAKRIAAALDGWTPPGAVSGPGGVADENPAETPAEELRFGTPGCACKPWTTEADGRRRFLELGETVDRVSGWHVHPKCPHQAPAVVSQPGKET